MDAVTLAAAAAFARKARSAGRVEAMPSLAQVFPEAMTSPPTLTLSAQTGTSPITSPLNSSTNGLGYNTVHASHRNGVFTALAQNSVTYWQNTVNAGDSTSERSMEFDWYGDKFAVEFRNVISGSSTLWVWVDGKPATARPVAQSAATVTGQPYWLTVDFGAVVARRIRIWCAVCDLAQLSYAAGCMAFPIVTRQKKIAMFGDSWIGGALSVSSFDLHGYLIPQLLGMEGSRAGQGSTGLTTAGTGAPKAIYTDATRLAKIVATGADYVYVHVSVNDDAANSASTVQTALATVCSTISTGLPTAKIIVMGPPRVNATPSSARLATRDGSLAAASAASNCIGYIDNITDTIYGRGGAVLQAATGIPWLTGTGNSSTPASDGTNADVYVGSDSAHMTTAGHRYWALRAANACKTILAVE